MPPVPPDLVMIGSDDYQAATGEPLSQTLDLGSWRPGEDLFSLYGRTEREIALAVRQESAYTKRIRQQVFPRLRERAHAPPGAGVYQTTAEEVARVHRGLLFTGNVEACDGTSVTHDTLPVTIHQIGVSLVAYHGDQGSWVHRVYRRDVRAGGVDPVGETLAVLERRQQRAGYDMTSPSDTLSDLARRGIMTYAERAALLQKSTAPWRMGHGNPLAYELLTGSGMSELVEQSLDLLHDLVVGHRRFVFVPSAPKERAWLTIGNALRPLEYAIVDTLEDWMGRLVDQGHYRGAWTAVLPRLRQFLGEVGPQVVVGAYRTSRLAPAHLFYAHRDHAHSAAHIALADSMLQEHRGFPMLISLADTVCGVMFGGDAFDASVQLGYLQAGEPFRYFTERQTRR